MSAKKRANGEGSIRKRYEGCWEGRYTAGYDILTGKRIQKGVFAKTKKECAANVIRVDFNGLQICVINENRNGLLFLILDDIRRCQVVQIYNKVASPGIGHSLRLLQEVEIEFLNEAISKLGGDCTLLRTDNEFPHLVLVGENDIRKIDLNTAALEVDRIQIDLLDVI